MAQAPPAHVKRSMKTVRSAYRRRAGATAPGSSLRTLLGLDWHLGRRQDQTKKKFKAGTHPSAKAASPDAKTKVSQSVADVLEAAARRRRASHRRVRPCRDYRRDLRGPLAPRTFGRPGSPTISSKTAPAGAKPLNAETVRGLDAIVVGGDDVGTRFRYALRVVGAHTPSLPVHWIAENWEFCAGTAAVPAEIDDLDALVFNHFEEFFGIKGTRCSSASR